MFSSFVKRKRHRTSLSSSDTSDTDSSADRASRASSWNERLRANDPVSHAMRVNPLFVLQSLDSPRGSRSLDKVALERAVMRDLFEPWR